MERQHLEKFRLKCEQALSLFKKKRRDNFVRYATRAEHNRWLGPRVSLLKRLPKPVHRDMGIDLSSSQRSVPEYLLHRAQIRTVIQ